MYHVYCWLENLSSPTINQSPTALKTFDERGFCPYGILNNLPIEL